VLQRRVSQTGIVYYISPLLEQIGVPHGFSTRIGGVSIAPFDSLNMGNPSGVEKQDEWERIHENYRRLQIAIGFAGKQRCWVHQVHGGDVVRVRRGAEFTCGACADALVGDDPERLLAVRVADCVPILIAAGDGHTVAAVHAGWRGVIARAVPAAVREIRRLTDQPIVAAVGPCIGFDAFEVGTEVVKQFEQSFGADAPVKLNGEAKGRVDLRRAVQLQLLAAGVTSEQIDLSDRCTYRDADEFFSHRRDRGVTGRMAALIAPAAS
jgi:purine-nucleoside/S-methyl-5'-thioadenosine phosphorylase / adenosine deaminase